MKRRAGDPRPVSCLVVKTHEQLAHPARAVAIQGDKPSGGLLDSLQHMFVRNERAGDKPRQEVRVDSLRAVAMVAPEETRDAQALFHNAEELARPGAVIAALVLRDGAAHGDLAESLHRDERGVQRLTAHVVEVARQALRRMPFEKLGNGCLPVVHRCVDAQDVDQPVRLVLRARAAQHARAPRPGELARDRPHRARRAGNEDGVAGLRLEHDLHPDPGREARHAEQAEMQAGAGDVRIDGLDRVRSGNEVCTPSVHAAHERPLVQKRRPRLLDDTYGSAWQHRAPRQVAGFTAPAQESQAEIGVDRHPCIANEDLVGARRGEFHLRDFEIGALQGVPRLGGQSDFFAGDGHGRP
ncbi:unannotated protein [freshwater metagenome]|uniref:Unannotated protein n=1 Tax=freshwater metagenome TaxID=449393 RepID=A0A6J7ALB5_9ZZZZ